jgi:hypothetical protein
MLPKPIIITPRELWYRDPTGGRGEELGSVSA